MRRDPSRQHRSLSRYRTHAIEPQHAVPGCRCRVPVELQDAGTNRTSAPAHRHHTVQHPPDWARDLPRGAVVARALVIVPAPAHRTAFATEWREPAGPSRGPRSEPRPRVSATEPPVPLSIGRGKCLGEPPWLIARAAPASQPAPITKGREPASPNRWHRLNRVFLFIASFCLSRLFFIASFYLSRLFYLSGSRQRGGAQTHRSLY